MGNSTKAQTSGDKQCAVGRRSATLDAFYRLFKLYGALEPSWQSSTLESRYIGKPWGL